VLRVGSVAKKDEMSRPQLSYTFTDPETNQPVTVPETDYVLTTRELGHLLKSEDVHFASVKPSNYDRLLGESTGAAALFAVTGGVLEAALRTAYETVTKTGTNFLSPLLFVACLLT
jgi:iron only hydrogenase large subunit-like protein